jgi:hypothetical protein
MGHFTIDLPDQRIGDVRWGKVRKLQLPFLWLGRRSKDEKTGYIIKVSSADGHSSEFRLFKTNEGKWSQDADGMKQIEDETAFTIKDAIERHDNTSTRQ